MIPRPAPALPRPLGALAPLALAWLAACAACEKRAAPAAGDEPAAGREVPSPDVLPKVHLTAADGTEHTVIVEVVREERELQRGLMYRRHLDADRGMLFLMGEETVHTFWMRNTYLALDMLFIGRDLTVVGIVENATPETDDLRSVGKPSLYVLEVNAGWTRARGVVAGAKVRFEHVRGL